MTATKKPRAKSTYKPPSAAERSKTREANRAKFKPPVRAAEHVPTPPPPPPQAPKPAPSYSGTGKLARAIPATLTQMQRERTGKLTLVKLPVSSITAAFNYLKPSWREYINYVEMAAKSGDVEMKRMIEVFTSLDGRERRAITPEQLCERANVDPSDLVAEVCRQLWKSNNFQAGIITAINHPAVIAKTAKSALGNSRSAQADRTNFLKGTGFLPQPKEPIFGNVVHNYGQIGAATPPPRPMLLSHEEEMKQLEAGEAEVLEAEEVVQP